MSAEQVFAATSIAVSLLALGLSTLLLARQNQQLEQGRNALAIIDAIGRITDPVIVHAFAELEGISRRFPDDDSIRASFDGSPDDHALMLVAQYVETVACLARRRVIDASLLVDAVGFMLRSRWNAILPFVTHLRRVRDNQYLFENFEWLALYSTWWKDEPRPPGDKNYDPKQFANVEFKDERRGAPLARGLDRSRRRRGCGHSGGRHLGVLHVCLREPHQAVARQSRAQLRGDDAETGNAR